MWAGRDCVLSTFGVRRIRLQFQDAGIEPQLLAFEAPYERRIRCRAVKLCTYFGAQLTKPSRKVFDVLFEIRAGRVRSNLMGNRSSP